ncbi:hypothetical protein LINPERHAP1_LOCUS15192, partial [Linum perenne]
MFQLTFWVGRYFVIVCDRISNFSCISVLLNEGLRLSLRFYLRVVSISAAFYSFLLKL